jgi:pimeloyl-ACP methyl ester carboxylesterase
MATILLVPGFWLGAWVWDDVAAELRAAGHDVRQHTLPGLADRRAEAAPDVDLDAHIDDIVATIGDLRDVVLVGHSGGNPIAGAADRIPERLRRVVYVDTGPMPDGMAQFDFYPPPEQRELRGRVAEHGDGWLIPVPPFDPAADPVNLAGLTPANLATLRERCTPQPFATSTQPIRRPADPPAVPGSLVLCTFTPEQLRELAEAGNPVFRLMAELDVHHLPTGHWPMLSRPRELAALLDKLAST